MVLKFRVLAFEAGILISAELVIGPTVKSALSQVGNVVGNEVSPSPSRSFTDHHSSPLEDLTHTTGLRIPEA